MEVEAASARDTAMPVYMVSVQDVLLKDRLTICQRLLISITTIVIVIWFARVLKSDRQVGVSTKLAWKTADKALLCKAASAHDVPTSVYSTLIEHVLEVGLG